MAVLDVFGLLTLWMLLSPRYPAALWTSSNPFHDRLRGL